MPNVPDRDVKPEILVYADEGAGTMCTRALVNSLRAACDLDRISIRTVTATDLVPAGVEQAIQVAGTPGDRYLTFAGGPPAWTERAVAIAFPGGADRPWTRQLNGAGNLAIRHFVEQGGTYLGFCAGAYYACERFTFEPDHPDPAWRITATRELALFRGTALGSLRELAKPYVLDELECTTTVPVQWLDPPIANPWAEVHERTDDEMNATSSRRQDRLAALQSGRDGDAMHLKPVPVLYWGGPCFVPDSDSTAELLGRYAGLSPERSIGIVRTRTGRGLALLSGAHIEVSAADYEQEGLRELYDAERTRAVNPQQARFERNVQIMREAEPDRQRLFRRFLEAANLGRWLRAE